MDSFVPLEWVSSAHDLLFGPPSSDVAYDSDADGTELCSSDSGCSVSEKSATRDLELPCEQTLVLAAGSAAQSPNSPCCSPRLQGILHQLDLGSNSSVMCCESALAMDEDAFGERTELVRELALQASLETELAAGSGSLTNPSQFQLTAAGGGRSLLAPAPRALAVPAGSARALACRAAQPGTSQLSAANLDLEDAEMARLAARLLDVSPEVLMFHSASDVPMAARRKIKLAVLSSKGADSLRKAIACMEAWCVFCVRNELADFGAAACARGDSDLMEWFLSEEDSIGIAAASGKRTGLHRKHSMAGAARWLFDHAGVPFGAAKSKHVRKASGPPKVAEPAWAEMWEVAVLAHLCRIAVFYTGPSAMIIRSYSLATFLVNAASLRLINGLRSGPARLDFTREGKPFASSVSAVSKGKRRSVMQPLPWLVPCVSPDASISDRFFFF